MEQYREYLGKSSDVIHRRMEPLVISEKWKAMTDERKTKVVSGIVEKAQRGERQRLKARIFEEREVQTDHHRAGNLLK